METYTLELTRAESIVLSDLIPAPSDQRDLHDRLVLKIGSAFLDTMGQDKPAVKVGLSRYELWLVRGLVKSNHRVGSEAVGLNLLEKVYRGLREFAGDELVHKAVTVVGERTDGADEPASNARALLAEWSAQQGVEDGRSQARSANTDSPSAGA